MRRISSHLLLTPSGLLPDRIVTVDGDGVITDISTSSHLDSEAGVEFYPGILIPGFVNAHCHLELSHLRGAIPPGEGFTAFVRGMRMVRRAESDGMAGFWDAKMWAEGVSAVADICNGASTFELKRRSRIKYHNFCELFGLHADPEKTFALCDEALAAGLTAYVTPHSLYSLNRDNYQLSIVNYQLSIHFLESADEVGLFHRKGAMWEWYREQGLNPDFLDYGSPAERLVAQTPRDRSVMLVHNCAVTQRDIDIVMEHFTAPVAWVLCPGSNRYISGLAPPVELLRRNGLQIAVGTDSLASNDTLSMIRELGMIKNVPLTELLGWATAGGAKALGMDDRLGTIEVGKSPGLVLLTGVDLQTLTLTENARTERII